MGWVVFDSEFVLRRYEFELERKEALAASIEVPILAVSLLAGAIVAMLRDVNYQPWSDWLFPFMVFVVLCVVTFVLCLVHLMRAYVDQTTTRIPFVEQLANDRMAYIAKAGEDREKADWQATRFNNDLTAQLAKAADANASRNDRRSEELFRLRRAIAWLLVFSVLTAIPYSIIKARVNVMSRSEPVTVPSAPSAPAQPAQLAPAPVTPDPQPTLTPNYDVRQLPRTRQR